MKVFFLFILYFIALFLSIDFIQKKFFTHTHWSRKATHIFSGLLIILMPFYLNRMQIFWLGIIFVVILTVSKWKKILSLHNVERKTLGEIFYPLSVSLLSVICLPDHVRIFQVSVLVLALSDGLAGIFGELLNLGTVRIFRNKKSLGGALTFFIVTCCILAGFHGITGANLLTILSASAFLTGLEFVFTFGTDNLVLPLSAALIEFCLFT
jgi:phytol kinase